MGSSANKGEGGGIYAVANMHLELNGGQIYGNICNGDAKDICAVADSGNYRFQLFAASDMGFEEYDSWYDGYDFSGLGLFALGKRSLHTQLFGPYSLDALPNAGVVRGLSASIPAFFAHAAVFASDCGGSIRSQSNFGHQLHVSQPGGGGESAGLV